MRRAGGRFVKMAPFRTRDLWARVWLAMKMKGLKLMRSAMMGLYLAWCLQRMGPTSEDLQRSIRKLPRMGRVKGQRRCFGVQLIEGFSLGGILLWLKCLPGILVKRG